MKFTWFDILVLEPVRSGAQGHTAGACGAGEPGFKAPELKLLTHQLPPWPDLSLVPRKLPKRALEAVAKTHFATGCPAGLPAAPLTCPRCFPLGAAGLASLARAPLGVRLRSPGLSPSTPSRRTSEKAAASAKPRPRLKARPAPAPWSRPKSTSPAPGAAGP